MRITRLLVFMFAVFTIVCNAAVFAYNGRALPPWKQLPDQAFDAAAKDDYQQAEIRLKLAYFIASVFDDKIAAIGILSDLFNVYFTEGHLGDAENCMETILLLTKDIYGDDSYEAMQASVSLAMFQAEQRKFGTAAKTMTNCIESAQYGKLHDSLDLSTAYQYQGMLLMQAGKEREGEQAYLRAFEGYKRAGRAGTIFAGLCADLIAEYYVSRFRLDDADDWYIVSLQNLRKSPRSAKVLPRIAGNYATFLVAKQGVVEARKTLTGKRTFSGSK